jgi:thiol-disulfide isomerase/thioredoxin
MTRFAPCHLFVLVFAFALPAWARELSPAEQYRDLEQEFLNAQQVFQIAYREARTEEERQDVLRARCPQPARYAPRFLDIAVRYPKDPAAADALIWVVNNLRSSPTPSRDDFRTQALESLQRHHAESKKLAACLVELRRAPEKAAEDLLRTALEKSPHREVQGLACFTLGTGRKELVRRANRVKNSPEMRELYEKDHGKEIVASWLALDLTALTAESERLLQRVVEQYDDVKLAARPDPIPLGKLAARHLFELRCLAVGKPAPEVRSQDLQGNAVKLSDLRGKVVVVDIWATTCGPCREMIPHERQLVNRLAGRPFVLVSISADEDRQTLRTFLNQYPMPWTHWFNGEEGGILDDWNVETFPTTYILDAAGVIRYKDIRGPQMEDAVTSLLKEMEAKK